MDSATGSIYFGDPGVDRHHLVIQNTHSILPSFEVRLKMTIEWTQGYTLTPWSSKYGDALGGRDQATLEMQFKHVIERRWMHLGAAIERVWRCTWRPRLSKFGDAIGSRDQAILEMHLEAAIEWLRRCIWKPRSSEFGDTLGGRDQASLEMHLEAIIERDWRSTRRRSIWRR